MRISDWSSDVCSSDLLDRLSLDKICRDDRRVSVAMKDWANRNDDQAAKGFLDLLRRIGNPDPAHLMDTSPNDLEIGRASCRERVCQYCENSVVAGSLKQKKE